MVGGVPSLHHRPVFDCLHAASSQKLEPERPGNKARKWDPVYSVLLVMCWRVSSREFSL